MRDPKVPVQIGFGALSPVNNNSFEKQNIDEVASFDLSMLDKNMLSPEEIEQVKEHLSPEMSRVFSRKRTIEHSE